MSRKEENIGFKCVHCGKEVLPCRNGSYRNHCPFCLVSIHVDIKPGDRANPCRGLMLPKGLVYKKQRWQILHVCQKCGKTKANKVATGSIQPDDLDVLISLSNA